MRQGLGRRTRHHRFFLYRSGRELQVSRDSPPWAWLKSILLCDVEHAQIIMDSMWVGYYTHGSITYKDILEMPINRYMEDLVDKYNILTSELKKK